MLSALKIMLNINNFRYPQNTGKSDIFKTYAAACLKKLKPRNNCERIQKGTDEAITEALYKDYNIPVLTTKVSCCVYPSIDNIPYIWRDTLEPIMTVLNFASTGIEGTVQDEHGVPMRNATLRVLGLDRYHEVSKISAHFKIMLPPATYMIEVACHLYQNITKEILVEHGKLLNLSLVLKQRQVSSNDDFEKPMVIGGFGDNGIKGFVKDELSHPIANAEIKVLPLNVTIEADRNGKYILPLPPGTYTFIISATGYHKDIKYFPINNTSTIQYVMFTLKKKQTVWGMPRLAFVIVMGFLCFGALGLLLMFYVACKRKSDYGLVSQHGFDEDFKDFDESKETEIFARPLPSKY